jgi:hypothetical protein
MRTLNRVVVAAALGVVAIGTVGIGSAAASTAPAGAAAVARPATVYPVPCWTSFAPVNPNGGPMIQYYANCSNTFVRVCPEEIINGQPDVVPTDTNLGPYDGIADSSDTAVWDWTSTIPGAHYTTVFC